MGSRLARPSTCPQNVYVDVQSTWEDNPDDRPRFSVLSAKFKRLVGENGGVEQCRDIGADLTGGRARAPSIVTSGNTLTGTVPAARGRGGSIASRGGRSRGGGSSVNANSAGRDRAATLARSSRIQTSAAP